MGKNRIIFGLVACALLVFSSCFLVPRWTSAQGPVNGSIEYHGSQRILNLWGTNYEMGYAHGVLLASDIMLMIEKYLFEYEVGGKALVWNNASAAMTHFTFGRYDAELLGMYDGMLASGANIYFDGMGRNVNLTDLKIWNAYLDVTPFLCSSFAVWGVASSDGGTMHARNLDHAYDTQNGYKVTEQLIIAYEPADGNQFVALSWPGFIGLVSGVNQYGLVLTGNHSNGSTSASETDYFPIALAGRQALETADDQDPLGDVWNVLTSTQRTKPYNVQVGSPYLDTGDPAVVIECDSSGQEIRTASVYSHTIATNHFIQRTPASDPKQDSVDRYSLIASRLIDRYYVEGDRKLDTDEALSILRDVEGNRTIHSLIVQPNILRLMVFFAQVSGFNPVVLTPAPETVPEIYLWSDLFPNHETRPTVDTFDEGEQSLTVDSGTQSASGTADVTTGDILGNERDVQLQWIEGDSNEIAVRIDSSDSNYVAYSADPNMKGVATFTWDGNDSNATGLDADGLGGVDLIGGVPDTNDAIHLAILNVGHNTAITVSAYTDDTHWSNMRISIPGDSSGSLTRMDVSFPFTGFTSRGTGGAVNWESLGALVVQIGGTVVADLDMVIDFITADSAREYGDLPLTDPNYGTTMLEANHIPKGLRLGHNVDAEATYNDSTDANGDDSNQASDEDGVALNLPWTAGTGGGHLDVTRYGCANVGICYINGWIDWDNDGDFGDTIDGASEHIIDNQSATTDGMTVYNFNTPTSFSGGLYYARFRICKTDTACDSPTSTNVDDGEIEDYRWSLLLGPTAVTLDSFSAAWQGGQVLVEWTTAYEVNTVGFNVWRSTGASGSYVQVNAALIPAESMGGMMGGSYSFTDASASPGSTYYYKLEEVETGAVRNWYGPASTGGGNSPTAVILSTFKAWGGAWWLAGAVVGVAGLGLAATRLWRRRRAQKRKA